VERDYYQLLDSAGALLLVLGDAADPDPLDLPPGTRPLGAAVRAHHAALAPALARLLHRHVLVSDWRAALDLVADRPDLVAVTAAGDRIGGAGAWSVGGVASAAVTQRALQEAQELATTAEVTRAEAERTVEAARAALGAARTAEVRRAAAEERRAVLGARLAEVETRLADRDPAAVLHDALAQQIEVHDTGAELRLELPFAKNTHGFVKQVLDGWATDSIIQLQSGLPMTPQFSGDIAQMDGALDDVNSVIDRECNNGLGPIQPHVRAPLTGSGELLSR